MSDGYGSPTTMQILGCDEARLEALERSGELRVLVAGGSKYYLAEDVARLAPDVDLEGHDIQCDIESIKQTRAEMITDFTLDGSWEHYERAIREALRPSAAVTFDRASIGDDEDASRNLDQGIRPLRYAITDLAELGGNGDLLGDAVASVRIRNVADPGDQGITLTGDALDHAVCLRAPAGLPDRDALVRYLHQQLPGLELYAQKFDVIERSLPERIERLAKEANKEIPIEVDWSTFGRSDDLQQNGRTIGSLEANGLVPLSRALDRMLTYTSFEARQTLRRRVDAIRFEHVEDREEEDLTFEKNTLVVRAVLHDRENRSVCLDLDTKLPEVVAAMPDSPRPVAEEENPEPSLSAGFPEAPRQQAPVELVFLGAGIDHPGPEGIVARFLAACAAMDEAAAVEYLTEASREGFDISSAPGASVEVGFKETKEEGGRLVVTVTFGAGDESEDVPFVLAEEGNEQRIDMDETMARILGFNLNDLL